MIRYDLWKVAETLLDVKHAGSFPETSLDIVAADPAKFVGTIKGGSQEDMDLLVSNFTAITRLVVWALRGQYALSDIIVTSGIRANDHPVHTDKRRRAPSGAFSSWHVVGRAIDLKFKQNNTAVRRAALKKLITDRLSKMVKLEVYEEGKDKTFIHVGFPLG